MIAIKSRKNWFIVSFLIVLFSLIGINLAKAGCVVVTVLYNDNCPRSGADVWANITEYLGSTGEDGKLTKCNHELSDGDYWPKAYWPLNPLTQFGSGYLYVDIYGDGSTTITDTDHSGNCGTTTTTTTTTTSTTSTTSSTTTSSTTTSSTSTTTTSTSTSTTTISDTTPPVITILSPQNATYYSNSTALTFIINEPTSWIGYSLDGQANKTIAGNIIMNVTDGPHNVIVYANDISGNMGSSQKIYFTNNKNKYLPWETSYIGQGGYPIIDIEQYNGRLYFVANNNNIYVFDGTSWSMIQAPISVLSIQNYTDGKLYVTGSGGKIYSFDGSTFNQIFDTGAQYSYARMLGIYNGKLYAATYLAYPAKLYYSSDGTNWQEDIGFSAKLNCPAPFCSIDSMGVYNGKMYLTSDGTIYQYDGNSWSILKTYSDVSSFTSMKVYNNKLYFTTIDSFSRCPMDQGYSGFCGRVILYNGTNWNTVFDHRSSNYKDGYWMYSLEVYNGRLYAGTADRIYMTSDGNNWQLTFDSVQGAQYAMVMKTWNNRIYVGLGNGAMFKDDMLEPTTTTTSITTTSTTTTTKKTTTTIKLPCNRWLCAI